MFCICLCKILNKLPFLGNDHWLSHFLTFVRAILPAFSVHLGLQKVVVAPSHVSSHAAKWRSEDLYMKVLVIDVGGTRREASLERRRNTAQVQSGPKLTAEPMVKKERGRYKCNTRTGLVLLRLRGWCRLRRVLPA